MIGIARIPGAIDTHFSNLVPAHQVRVLAAIGDRATRPSRALEVLMNLRRVLQHQSFHDLADSILSDAGYDIKVEVIDWVTDTTRSDKKNPPVSGSCTEGRFGLLQLITRYEKGYYNLQDSALTGSVRRAIVENSDMSAVFLAVLEHPTYGSSFWSMKPEVHIELGSAIRELETLPEISRNRAGACLWGNGVKLLFELLNDKGDPKSQDHYSAEVSFYSQTPQEQKRLINEKKEEVARRIQGRP